MISIKNSAEQFNSFMSELKGKMKDWVKQEVEARLESEVEQWLHRQPYKRRKCVRGQKTQAQCNRCGARYAGRFSRNGHRSRQLVTCVGVLDVWLPRVVCECGGSVNIPFSIVEPYQRFWTDLLAQIGRWLGNSSPASSSPPYFQTHTLPTSPHRVLRFITPSGHPTP